MGAIALLSGGMDSATALFWALSKYDTVVAINFNYGQRGRRYEYAAACKMVDYASRYQDRDIKLIARTIHVSDDSALTDFDRPADDPSRKRDDGLPDTFVPARNLIFIAHTAAIAYERELHDIVGGWSGVDVDYPDCRPSFIRSATLAIRQALGSDQFSVVAPIVSMSKAQTVRLGQSLGVPWALTRSCYMQYEEPCLECDSCRLRMRAFAQAGIRDPLVPIDAWMEFISAGDH